MSSPIRMICPNLKCRAVLSVPAHTRGMNVRCRKCGMRVQVPKPKTETPDTGSAQTPGPENAAATTEQS